MSKNRIHFSIEEKVVPDEPFPPIIFIVPYRDREQQLEFFKIHMARIMEGIHHRILYIHQYDNRGFNRGALKNIGFMVVKQLYPANYKKITLVFNDIDTAPFTKGFLKYETTPGTIKHFYGFRNTLGGIVSIMANDFEKINGFPNFWTWGFEDNLLQIRAEKAGLKIDRSQFYPIHDKNILHVHDGTFRDLNRGEFDRYLKKTQEGWRSIANLNYDIDNETGFVHVNTFDTGLPEDTARTISYDLTKGNSPFKVQGPRRGSMGMFI